MCGLGGEFFDQVLVAVTKPFLSMESACVFKGCYWVPCEHLPLKGMVASREPTFAKSRRPNLHSVRASDCTRITGSARCRSTDPAVRLTIRRMYTVFILRPAPPTGA